jgi:capsular polysaccharide transport system permease protein
MQLIGLSRSQDDAYAVRDYLLSRNALAELDKRVGVRRMFDNADVDFLTRYPSFIFNSTDEDFYRYFQFRLNVYVNSSSGLTILQAEALNGPQAALIATTLLRLGEEWINRLNERVLQDAVRVAQGEVTRAEQRRVDSQVAITTFRNHELVLDPTKNAAIVMELIGKLATELATVRADLAELKANAPGSPQLESMNQRAEAIEQQIALERGRIATGSDGLADKIATFEKLMLEQQFATRSLEQAMSALQAARTEARRQQLFLEHVVEPIATDKATEPRRWRVIATVVGFNIVGFGIAWLIFMGLRDHSYARR